MKKILIVGLYPTESCPIFSLEFAKALLNCNHSVYAILPDDVENKSQWIQYLGKDKIAFIKIAKTSKIQKYTNIINFVCRKNRIISNVKNVEFDIVFYTFFHRWNELLQKYIHARKHILFVHDPIPHSDENKNRLKLQKKQIGKMNSIIVLSKIFFEDCKKLYGLSERDIFYMPHCLMNYGNKSLKTPYTSGEVRNFLFFGRITKYKGLNVLIEAFTRLEKEYSSARLFIVGGGDFSDYAPQFSKLKNADLINDYIPDDEIDKWFLQENTVCVLPYLDATQSGVIAIAYEYGTAVIATDSGGLREQLGDGELGIFCEAGNAEDLYLRMKEVCNDSRKMIEESEKMSDYSKTLSWDAVTEKLLQQINNQ